MKTFAQVYFRKIRMMEDFTEAFRKLKTVTRDPSFRDYRERYLELILAVLTVFSVLEILGSQFIDYLQGTPDITELFILRITSSGLIVANFSVYLFFLEKAPVRWFVYPPFYLMTVFSPIFTYYTGGIGSVYWYEMIFILVAWFMMIPFSYKRLGIHALIMTLIYTVTLIILIPHPISWLLFTEHGLVYVGVFLLGMMVSIFNTLFSASVFISEQRVRKSEERFRMFTQNSLDVVWTIDAKTGRFTYLSPSVFNLRGYHPGELIGQTMEDSLTPASKQRIKELIGQAQEEIRKGNTENVVIGELEQYKKNGETVWIEVIASFITDNQGEITEVIGDSRNITERKKAESELLKIQQQLREESRKLQQENLRIQYESLKNQINPHFLFNSLNVLTSLIRLDAILAEKFTEQLSKVYRYVLEHREEDLVSLEIEMDFIASYTFLLEIRFKDKVKVDIRIPDAIKELFVPPLTTQLLIENAVKHNTFSKKQPLVIDIFADEENYLNVVNNLQKREMHMESTGVGLVNIGERIRMLTDRPVFFGEAGDKFVARIPLFKEKNCLS